MIVYALGCGNGHFFEGWFASSEACDRQASAGQLQCPTCSTLEVRKLPSAPYVQTSGGAASPAPQGGVVRSEAAATLRRFLLANTEDVGRKFAEVARRIHYREEAARNIRGAVTPEEAVDLHEEGIETYTIAPEAFPPGDAH